jgi:hypothetical protein
MRLLHPASVTDPFAAPWHRIPVAPISAAEAYPTHTDDLEGLKRLLAHDPDALWVAG